MNVLKTLHALGLTNLPRGDLEVAEPRARMPMLLWLLHSLGLTNLSDAQVSILTEHARTQSADAPTDMFPVPVGKPISVHQVGLIEGNINDLVQVIVAAHQVERPTNALYAAVERNFERGVQYTFLISRSRAEQEIDGYYRIFRAIAHIVISRTRSSFKVEDLVTIRRLSFDWRDTPYIFYQAKATNGQLATVALRGSQKYEGIAESYQRLPQELAHTIALALFSDAPQPLAFSEEEFEQVPLLKIQGGEVAA